MVRPHASHCNFALLLAYLVVFVEAVTGRRAHIHIVDKERAVVVNYACAGADFNKVLADIIGVIQRHGSNEHRFASGNGRCKIALVSTLFFFLRRTARRVVILSRRRRKFLFIAATQRRRRRVIATGNEHRSRGQSHSESGQKFRFHGLLLKELRTSRVV